MLRVRRLVRDKTAKITWQLPQDWDESHRCKWSEISGPANPFGELYSELQRSNLMAVV